MPRTNNEDYLPENKVKLEYSLDHPSTIGRRCNSFKFYDLPPMGLGPSGAPFISLDNYLDLSSIDAVRQEIEDNIHLATASLTPMIPFGLIPEHINNEKCLDSFLLNPDKYNVSIDSNSYASKLTNYHEVKTYFLNRFNLTRSWKRVLHLRNLLSFYDKGSPSTWNSTSHHFPKLRALIEALPLKHAGIALIFRSNEDSRLLIHRDSYARNHSLHHINISLSKNTRKVFIYDSIKNERIYLDGSTRSYTFNENDLHGAEPQFDHLVLRVDGQFEDWLCKQLEYENNTSFDWAYDKPQAFMREHGKINVWTNTDI